MNIVIRRISIRGVLGPLVITRSSCGRAKGKHEPASMSHQTVTPLARTHVSGIPDYRYVTLFYVLRARINAVFAHPHTGVISN
jgi:hypothetical protein